MGVKQILRIVLASLAALTGAALALDQAKVIALTKDEIVGAIVVIAAVAIASPLVEALQDWSAANRLRYEQEMSQTLRGLLETVAQFPGIDWRSIGASVFLVQRRHWYWPANVLKRVAYEGFVYVTPPVPSEWSNGQGVPGQCWASGADAAADLGALEKLSAAQRAEQWDRLPADDRLGLSYLAFQAIKPKGAEIVSPIVVGDRVLGVVSLNAPSDAYGHLVRHPSWVALGFTAVMIRTILAHYGK